MTSSRLGCYWCLVRSRWCSLIAWWTSGNVSADESLGQGHRRASGQGHDGTYPLTNPFITSWNSFPAYWKLLYVKQILSFSTMSQDTLKSLYTVGQSIYNKLFKLIMFMTFDVSSEDTFGHVYLKSFVSTSTVS